MDKAVKVKEILDLNGSKLLQGDENKEINECSTNTKTKLKGESFFAIDKAFDYIEQALVNDCPVCVVEKDVDKHILEKYSMTTFVKVQSGLETLQHLASIKRAKYDIPVVAITGSVGKTSTKDIVANVVGTEYNVLKTEGNFNNHIGLPLTIMRLREHNALVLEMGMNHLHEIELLSKIAKPTIAAITNVGTSHIGNLGSRENILKAKLEIIEGLKDNGTIIINNDNDMLNEWNEKTRLNNVLTYGIDEGNEIQAKDVEIGAERSKFKTQLDEQIDVDVPVSGEHFIYNALCAIAVGKTLGIKNENIKKGVQTFELTGKRMEVEKTPNLTIINDAYNASYESIKHSLEFLNRIEGNRKIAILGDVLELGEFANELHSKIGEEVNRFDFDILITVGSFSKIIYDTANTKQKYHFMDNKDVVEYLKNSFNKNDVILLKASNGMRFAQIFEEIKKI